MGYVRAGQLVRCRDIIFKDINKVDIKEFHPGIVLFPTDDVEDEILALHMTSAKSIAKKAKQKYVEIDGISKKSFVNLGQIENVKNNFENQIESGDYFNNISFEEYSKILKKFYNYQMNPNIVQDENFLKIKPKLEIMLSFVDIQENARFYTDSEKILDINPKTVEVLEALPSEKREKFIIINVMYRCESNNSAEKFLDTLNLTQVEKDDIFKLYTNSKRINECNESQLEKIVIGIVENARTSISIIAVENFLTELGIALQMVNNDGIKTNKFIEESKKQLNAQKSMQREKELDKKIEEEKRKLKKEKAIRKSELKKEKKNYSNQKENERKKMNKKRKLMEKYGKFDGFDF